MALKPIRIQPARERVASALRTAIITNQVKEGDVLVLDATAQELGVSITPVREAYQILARDGLIELKRGKTAVVRGLTPTTIREHYEVRAALESTACVLCCEREGDLGPVGENLETAKADLANDDLTSYDALNRGFHYAIWTASGNEKLCSMLAELWNGLSMGANITKRQYAEKSIGEHEAIFAALEARDAEAARQRMVQHIMRSEGDILTIYC